MRQKADNSGSIFAIRRTDLSLIPSVLAIWRELLLVRCWSFWQQIRPMSPTSAMFCAVRDDFGRPLPDWRVTADLVLVMWRQIVFRVFKLHCFAGYLDLMALAPSPCSCRVLNTHIVFVRYSYPLLILFKLLRIPAAKYLRLLLLYDITNDVIFIL